VPERFAAQVKEDQPVELHVEAYPDDVFQATVARISPTVNPESRTFEIEAYVPNTDHRLQDGGFAKAAVMTQTAAQAVTAPLESLVTFAGVTKVFCVVDGKAQGVPVTVGTRGEGWVELVGAIEPGTTVVTSGQRQLADGVAVTVREAVASRETVKR
jgi:RND family efflux transporter MFP subunit